VQNQLKPVDFDVDQSDLALFFEIILLASSEFVSHQGRNEDVEDGSEFQIVPDPFMTIKELRLLLKFLNVNVARPYETSEDPHDG